MKTIYYKKILSYGSYIMCRNFTRNVTAYSSKYVYIHHLGQLNNLFGSDDMGWRKWYTDMLVEGQIISHGDK